MWNKYPITRPRDNNIVCDIFIKIENNRSAVVRDCIYKNNEFTDELTNEVFNKNVIEYRLKQKL